MYDSCEIHVPRFKWNVRITNQITVSKRMRPIQTLPGGDLVVSVSSTEAVKPAAGAGVPRDQEGERTCRPYFISVLKRQLVQHRYGGVVLFYLVFLAVAFCTRAALLTHSFRSVDVHAAKLLGVLAFGLAYDIAAAAYGSIPLVLGVLLAPRRWLVSRWHRLLCSVFYFVLLYALLFGTVAEWLFWEEFQARFNFIAVDYLVYTTEVIGNIQESYPLPVILGALALASGAAFFALWKTALLQNWYQAAALDHRRFRPALAFLLVPVIGHLSLSNRNVPEFGNAINQELARDGLYSFFAAYWENELSYDRFYATLPEPEAFARLRPLLREPNAEFVSTDSTNITRRITHIGPEKHWNVIQITVESLSAKYLGAFGNRKELTPNLDRLFEDSLVFTNLYATGTRTVRGMEALTLSVPPTPGQSIVRRPQNEHLFSLGALFRSRGYDTAFIYSGYGYFDNMNAFFAANDYRVIDRSSVAKEDITYATVWGACDEDLYRWTLREADHAFAQDKPFHYFVMTTSNHRPYGFPEGRIDMPSGSRLAAVKYTDYAIGQLLEAARNKPWFTNTLFVIVADHCASAAGKSALPVNGYHIPAFIWNPLLVPAEKNNRFCSQIDLPPTVLGLMGWAYDSRFYGKDILRLQPESERAIIATYQKLGYLNAGKMALLEPVRRRRAFNRLLSQGDQLPLSEEEDIVNDAIATYQTASYLFTHGLNRADAAR